MKKFGLVGHPLGHSFSKKYFTEKFDSEGIREHRYDQFDLTIINEFPDLWKDQELLGVNVTIPYKEQVIPFLDDLDDSAKGTGAVNVVKKSNGKLRGFNTDYPAFKASLEDWLDGSVRKALVLGTGGASKAIRYGLNGLGIGITSVSRSSGTDQISYQELLADPGILTDHHLIINTTPLGTFPEVSLKPNLPYEALTANHFLYDLVYNPEVTAFLQMGIDAGAKTKNGYEMLERQAELSWEIWNS